MVQIRRLLTAPVFEDEEEKTRVARMLNTILLGILAVTLVFCVVAPMTSPNPLLAEVAAGLCLLPQLAAVVLMRRGKVRLASTLLASMLWGVLTLWGFIAGGVQSSGFNTYVVVILLAAFLIGWRAAVGFTALTVVAGVLLFYAGISDFLPPSLMPITQVSALTVWIANISAVTALVYMAVHSLNEALGRAQRNERDLAERNRELQVTHESLRQRNEYLQDTVQTYVDHMAKVGRGNLSARLVLDEGDGSGQDDPLAVLGHNLNETVASLQRMIAHIRDTANNLGSASTEILAAATQQVAGATEQSTAITQATTTIDEVRSIAEQTAQRAQGVAGLAQQTAEVSDSGQQAVAQTLGGMSTVKDKVETIAQNILALSEQAQAVGQIITTVNEIAKQSNMLALNAAVEAARAGETGKGFAVVAAEVRTLADQSRGATIQVKEILSEIQRGVNAAVMATEEGMKGADAGMKLAGEAGLALQKLAESVAESTQAALQIAAAAGQQLTGMEQIATAMENIHQVTGQSVAGTRQTEKAAEELNGLAGELRELVGQYRL